MDNNEQHQAEGTTLRSDSALCITAVSASIVFGLLFTWLLVRPIAFGVEESTLLIRYAAYAAALFALFAICDSAPFALLPLPLCPLCGLAAAACTASAYLYLQVFGRIPVLWLVCGLAWFKIGYGIASCWGAPSDQKVVIILLQLSSLAAAIVAMSFLVLAAVLVNDALLFMAPLCTASFW